MTDRIVQHQVHDRIRQQGPGAVFVPRDFLDLGSRDAVDKALARLSQDGVLDRIGRGLYHVPQINQRLGLAVAPDQQAVAAALARQTGSQVIASGAVAANLLGLTTQVSAKPVYFTTGTSRNVTVGKRVFHLKRSASLGLPGSDAMTLQVIQALRFIGKDAITSQVTAQIRKQLTPDQRDQLLRASRYVSPSWIADAARQIADTNAMVDA